MIVAPLCSSPHPTLYTFPKAYGGQTYELWPCTLHLPEGWNSAARVHLDTDSRIQFAC